MLSPLGSIQVNFLTQLVGVRLKAYSPVERAPQVSFLVNGFCKIARISEDVFLPMKDLKIEMESFIKEKPFAL